MNYYNRKSETKQGTVFNVMVVSQEYLNCKKAVEKVGMSIKKLIASIQTVFENVIPMDRTGQLQEQYKYCLKHTVSVALDDVDKFIEEYNVTRDYEIKTLRAEIINLLDDVDALFNQE